MEEESDRARIVELFERHRARPGAAYDEQHFLDFLLAEPRKARSVYNSFRGLRRLNAFIDDVQLEFGICFSLKDHDANYSLDKFVERTMKLESSRRGSLMSLENRERAGAGWQVPIMGNIVLLIVGIGLRANAWATAALVGVAVLMNAFFVKSVRKERAYLKRLRARIEKRES